MDPKSPPSAASQPKTSGPPKHWLIAGLGNPGPQYQLTRHNIGFIAIDMMAKGLGVSNWSSQEKALTAKVKWGKDDVLFVKPQNFMNRSGESVQPLLSYFKIPLENLIVIHDELEFAFGKMKLHKNKSPGGHNGIRSIAERLGTNDYIRLRLGIGRPPHPEMDPAAYVLGRFSAEEEKLLPDFLNRASDAVECTLGEGLPKASSLFNV